MTANWLATSNMCRREMAVCWSFSITFFLSFVLLWSPNMDPRFYATCFRAFLISLGLFGLCTAVPSFRLISFGGNASNWKHQPDWSIHWDLFSTTQTATLIPAVAKHSFPPRPLPQCNFDETQLWIFFQQRRIEQTIQINLMIKSFPIQSLPSNEINNFL